MTELIIVILGLIAVSFTCSVLESVILSMTMPYIQMLVDRGSRSGKVLKRLKERIDEPIAAILTLNTISHTVGAAVSGALAIKVFGAEWMGLFSAVLTFLILVFSEIIPKTLGAQFWKELGPISAVTLRVMIILLKPLIVPMNLISRLMSSHHTSGLVSKAEIYSFMRIGHSQGVLGTPEFRIIDNLFDLREVTVSDVMTPSTVVFSLPAAMTVKDVVDENIQLQFSRIPLTADDGSIKGIVLRRDIMDMVRNGSTEKTLHSLSRPVLYVRDTTTVLTLMNWLVAKRTHLVIVVNDRNNYAGIVTIEDAIETLLGAEIVDEFDPAVDMRALADEGMEK